MIEKFNKRKTLRSFRDELKKVPVKKDNTNFILALSIAVIPGYAYLLAFCYEYGYCVYYKLPIFFISVDITTTLKLMASILVLSISINYFSIFFAPLITVLQKELFNPYRNLILMLSFPSLILLLIGIIYGKVNSGIIIFCSLLQFVLIIRLFPIWKGKFKGKKIADIADSYIGTLSDGSLISIIIRKIGIKAYIIIIFLIGIVILSYLVGNSQAFKEKEYLIVGNDSSKVVIKNLSGSLICASYDKNNGKFGERISIISINDKSISQLNRIIISEKMNPNIIP